MVFGLENVVNFKDFSWPYKEIQLRYPLDSDLSGGSRYPTFEQPEPQFKTTTKIQELFKIVRAMFQMFFK